MITWLRSMLPRKQHSIAIEQKRRRYELASGVTTVYWSAWTPDLAKRLKR